MEACFKLKFILVALVILTDATQATTAKYQFTALKPGENITGKTGATYTTYATHCSRRCSTETECRAYQYTTSRTENCILIYRNSTAEDGLSFTSDAQNIIYKIDGVFKYTSQCSGSNCETDINECDSMSCFYGNCSDSINGYTCDCSAGYTGVNCEEDIDECESNPCAHGNCTDMFNEYNCICQNGFSGQNCEDTVCTQPSSWNPDAGWSGPDAELYWSFDCVDSLVLMEESTEVTAVVIPGKVNNAISVDRTRSQWVDLLPDRTANQGNPPEILEGPCLPRPQDCGAAGGAVAFWMRRTDTSSSCGVISSRSRARGTSASFQVSYSGTTLSFEISTKTDQFRVDTTITGDWTHVVLNYIGPDDGQGMQVYLDGSLTGSDDTREAKGFTVGSGSVVIGRQFTNRDEKYGSVDIDELLFFNSKLTGQQITSIKNMI